MRKENTCEYWDDLPSGERVEEERIKRAAAEKGISLSEYVESRV